jgi:hypothetical protein
MQPRIPDYCQSSECKGDIHRFPDKDIIWGEEKPPFSFTGFNGNTK